MKPFIKTMIICLLIQEPIFAKDDTYELVQNFKKDNNLLGSSLLVGGLFLNREFDFGEKMTKEKNLNKSKISCFNRKFEHVVTSIAKKFIYSYDKYAWINNQSIELTEDKKKYHCQYVLIHKLHTSNDLIQIPLTNKKNISFDDNRIDINKSYSFLDLYNSSTEILNRTIKANDDTIDIFFKFSKNKKYFSYIVRLNGKRIAQIDDDHAVIPSKSPGGEELFYTSPVKLLNILDLNNDGRKDLLLESDDGDSEKDTFFIISKPDGEYSKYKFTSPGC